jgi:hypothetical protein
MSGNPLPIPYTSATVADVSVADDWLTYRPGRPTS